MKTKTIQQKIDKAIARRLEALQDADPDHGYMLANTINTLVLARGQLDTQRDVAEED